MLINIQSPCRQVGSKMAAVKRKDGAMDKTWRRIIACAILSVTAGFCQQPSGVKTQNLPPPPPTLGNKPPGPGAQARVLGRLKAEPRPLKMLGPFRVGPSREGARLNVAPPVRQDGGNEWVRPQDVRTRTATASKSSVPPGLQERLVMGGPSLIEAFSHLPKPGNGIKPFSNDLGESVYLTEAMRSPALTTLWQLDPSPMGCCDPQIAVSRTVVAVLRWGQLSFFDKSGTFLPAFPGPFALANFFWGVLPDVDASLNLNPAVANNPLFKMCEGPQGPSPSQCGDVGDARIVFDAIHSRWLVLATAKNDNGVKLSSEPWAYTQRRTKFLLAVSTDEDPSKGFLLYAFNATPDDGACNSTDSSPCPNSSFIPGYAGDYPSIGVSDKYYLITDHFNSPKGGLDHAYLVVINAQDAMNGNNSPHHHWFYDWDTGGGSNASEVTMPVVNQEKLFPNDMGMVLNTHDDELVITTVSNDDPPVLNSLVFEMQSPLHSGGWAQKGSDEQIDLDTPDQPVTANMLNHTLVLAFNHNQPWVGTYVPSVDVFTADVTGLPFGATQVKNRTFGWHSPLDDPANDVVGYGMPGIAMNKDGDIAVVYNRTSPMLYYEARYSTWMHNEPDLRPSRILRKGDGPIPMGGCSGPCGYLKPETAGVALDPFDRTGIWMGHFYANAGGGTSMVVGKVFGKAYPDLTVPQVDFSPKSPKFLHPGDTVTVSYTMYNGGDGPAGNPRGEVRLVPLSTNGAPRIFLGEDTVKDLAPGETVQRSSLTFPIPGNVAVGRYAIEVEARIRGGDMTEYSTENNTGSAQILEVLPPEPKRKGWSPKKGAFK
jgi:hypothetical protein